MSVVAIVVPVLDEAGPVPRLLRSLADLDRPEDLALARAVGVSGVSA